TLPPWIPANRNGDVRSQVRIAMKDVLSTTRAFRRLLLGGLSGATDVPPVLSAHSKDSSSLPLLAAAAALSASASAGLFSPLSTAYSFLLSSSSPPSSLSSFLMSAVACSCLSPLAYVGTRFEAVRGGLPNDGSVAASHELTMAMSVNIPTERLLRRGPCMKP